MSAYNVSVQGIVPAHIPPLQPPKVTPLPGFVALTSVTTDRAGYVALQVPGQLMRPSVERICPLTGPIILTESVTCCQLKLAVTCFGESTSSVQVVAVPEQSPPQLVKVAPCPAVAVNVTVVGVANDAPHGDWLQFTAPASVDTVP